METRTAQATIASVREELTAHDLLAQGRLDADAILALRHAVASAIAERAHLIFIDVSRVSGVTPSGVAGMLDLLRLVRSRGGDLRLYGNCGAIDEAHTALQLNSVTRVYADRTAASLAGRRKR